VVLEVAGSSPVFHPQKDVQFHIGRLLFQRVPI
jgi:hypothetical protein